MELRHLRYFVTIAEELSFTRASARLNVGQPPLSKQIHDLERELGGELFIRLGRGIKLSAMGRAFYADAKAVLSLAERANLNARQIARGERGSVQVGIDTVAGFHEFVPWVIGQYRRENPHVQFALREANPGALSDELRNGTVDVTFVHSESENSVDLRIEHLFEERMLAALPRDHCLAKKDTLRFEMLANEAFVLHRRDNAPSIFDSIRAASEEAGFMLQARHEAQSVSSCLNIVATGVGVAVVPDCVRRLQTPGVVFRRLEEGGPSARLSLQFRPAPVSRNVADFVSLASRATLPGRGAWDRRAG